MEAIPKNPVLRHSSYFVLAKLSDVSLKTGVKSNLAVT